jgi:polar amino acid transport system substrate-binding protein
MPLKGQMETPWAMAVKMGEDKFKAFMESVHSDWFKSGTIVALEKKWNIPPTDYAKRMHEKAKGS